MRKKSGRKSINEKNRILDVAKKKEVEIRGKKWKGYPRPNHFSRKDISQAQHM
jgi:hypothetical protein